MAKKKVVPTLHPYSDPGLLGSLGGLTRYQRATKQSKRKAQKELEAIEAYSIHKDRRRKIRRNPVVVLDSRHQYQADLMDVSGISKLNKHRKFCLIVIDCFSKRARCLPIKNKTGEHVKQGFEQVFKEMGKPAKLQVDQGKEFWNKIVKSFMVRESVLMFSSKNPEVKAGMAERFIRTIRTRLARLFRTRGNKKYYDALPNIIKTYNATEHASHRMAPNDVKDTNSLLVFNRLYRRLLVEKTRIPLFKKGDRVRTYVDKSLFAKGYMPNFHDEICTVQRVILHHPEPVYVVCDSSGLTLPKKYYEKELSSVKRK